MTEEMPLHPEDLMPGTSVTGKVTCLVLAGAMVDIGMGEDALLHLSQLGQSDFRNIGDVYNEGDEIESFVLKVDPQTNYVALTMVKPPALPWETIRNGETYRGTVERIENFGAFIDIGAERPGMVHVSEMADGYVQSPTDIVNVGDEVDVRVIKVDRRRRQIDLSMKTPMEEIQEILQPEEVPTAMEVAMRRAQRAARRQNRKKRRRNEYDDYE